MDNMDNIWSADVSLHETIIDGKSKLWSIVYSKC